ncbi:ABC transporter permease [Micromonospora sp. WMMD1102]|uniref:ABC transporter permease n=1 Tax=Micromonospora sp. WMMD1102 TaxID=3016105 RepID=UPI0024155649|nr:ABC transporter permease [Micromonospora sp. WMMD1102]MDG4788066.1 ABC transporter permease [Micromonospora sp. WMMD1102]
MLRTIRTRLGVAAVSIAGVAVLIFFITQLLPGDPARIAAGQYATEEQVDQVRATYGLDRTIPEQFGAYVSDLLRFDLGTSIRTSQPVREELLDRLPATLELGLLALLIAVVLGVGLGVLAAVWRYRAGDKAIQIFVVLASATTVIWIALVAIYLFVNQWGIFNSPIGRLPRGYPPPEHVTGFYVVDALLAGDTATAGAALRTLLLPALLLGVLASPSIIKIVRSSTIRALDSDYARTARSFGYPVRSILLQEGLRNALLPVITNVGLVAGFVLAGGNVLIEQLFAWPGIGGYAYRSLQENDLFALRGYVIFIGVAYVVINTLLEFLYRWADPRVALAEGS